MYKVKGAANNTSAVLPAVAYGAVTDKGRLREENEDVYHIEAEVSLFLISDGMGGHRGGALASKIVAEDLPVIIETGLDRLRSQNPRRVRALLKKAVVEQNMQLLMEGNSESGYKDMGATLALLLIRQQKVYLANLGDSRIYRLRRDRLRRLSRDHSVVSELLHAGKIEPADAENHSAAGELTHYIGMGAKARPCVRSFALRSGDRFLLCTDGLTDMVDDKLITRILRSEPDPQTVAHSLVNTANAAGGEDNVTAVVVDWHASEQAAPASQPS